MIEEFLKRFDVTGIQSPESLPDKEFSNSDQCSNPSEGDGCGGSGDCSDGCDDGC